MHDDELARPRGSWKTTMLISVASYLLLTQTTGCTPSYHSHEIRSNSMAPTLHVGDEILVQDNAYIQESPKRGDLVLVDSPIIAGQFLVKRVVGLPGEEFELRHGTLYINGRRILEPYVKNNAPYTMKVTHYSIIVDSASLSRSVANIPPPENWSTPNRLPRGCYVTLGDNRVSEGSNLWGCTANGGRFDSGLRHGQESAYFGKVIVTVPKPTKPSH